MILSQSRPGQTSGCFIETSQLFQYLSSGILSSVSLSIPLNKNVTTMIETGAMINVLVTSISSLISFLH
ncbi:hypothetical protein PM082_004250 [Marasmius tenuissimus]|nr:hypothetical protein PM082_004250 [Marasmius tenuissimus]